MSDNDANSDDDDAKTERYRDPTPPGDDFMPRGEEYMPIATGTGLLLPIVTREQARDAQMEGGSESGGEQPDAQEVPAPKKKSKKKVPKAPIPVGNQLKKWVFRYTATTFTKVVRITFSVLKNEAKKNLSADITHFKQVHSPEDHDNICIEFHTCRRVLRSRMETFLSQTFNLGKLDQKLLPSELKHLRDANNEKLNDEDDDYVAEISMNTNITMRVVELERSNKEMRDAMSEMHEEMDKMRAKMKNMKTMMKELTKTGPSTSDA